MQQLAGDVAARGGERKALRIDLVQLQIAACRVGLDARGGDVVQINIAARGVQRQHAGELRVPHGNAPAHGRKARALRLHIRNIHISRGRAGCYRAAAGRADKNISARRDELCLRDLQLRRADRSGSARCAERKLRAHQTAHIYIAGLRCRVHRADPFFRNAEDDRIIVRDGKALEKAGLFLRDAKHAAVEHNAHAVRRFRAPRGDRDGLIRRGIDVHLKLAELHAHKAALAGLRVGGGELDVVVGIVVGRIVPAERHADEHARRNEQRAENKKQLFAFFHHGFSFFIRDRF